MEGRALKAEAVGAGVPLYKVAAQAGMHPHRLGAYLNGRTQLDTATEQRIRQAIQAAAERPQ